MDPLKRKKLSRTALRRHCKKLEDDVDQLLAAFPDDGMAKLRTLRVNYEAQIAKVDAASNEIAGLIDDEAALITDYDECLVLSEVFYKTLGKIDEKLTTAIDTKPTVRSTGGAVDVNTKLPKIELKPFEGDILH